VSVERRYRARRLNDVHDSVDDDRRILDHVARLSALINPDRSQMGDVLPIDCLQPRETPGPVIATIHVPVLRLLIGVEKLLV
jgi:hypothetical protein